MILLLDSHVLVWALTEPAALAPQARQAIVDPVNEVLVSVGSIWELEIKRASGKLRFDMELADEIERIGFSTLPIGAVDAAVAARLPLHHGDPFDRMVIAQAQRLDAIVVTRDRAFGAYDVGVLTA